MADREGGGADITIGRHGQELLNWARVHLAGQNSIWPPFDPNANGGAVLYQRQYRQVVNYIQANDEPDSLPATIGNDERTDFLLLIANLGLMDNRGIQILNDGNQNEINQRFTAFRNTVVRGRNNSFNRNVLTAVELYREFVPESSISGQGTLLSQSNSPNIQASPAPSSIPASASRLRVRGYLEESKKVIEFFREEIHYNLNSDYFQDQVNFIVGVLNGSSSSSRDRKLDFTHKYLNPGTPGSLRQNDQLDLYGFYQRLWSQMYPEVPNPFSEVTRQAIFDIVVEAQLQPHEQDPIQIINLRNDESQQWFNLGWQDVSYSVYYNSLFRAVFDELYPNLQGIPVEHQPEVDFIREQRQHSEGTSSVGTQSTQASNSQAPAPREVQPPSRLFQTPSPSEFNTPPASPLLSSDGSPSLPRAETSPAASSLPPRPRSDPELAAEPEPAPRRPARPRPAPEPAPRPTSRAASAPEARPQRVHLGRRPVFGNIFRNMSDQTWAEAIGEIQAQIGQRGSPAINSGLAGGAPGQLHLHFNIQMNPGVLVTPTSTTTAASAPAATISQANSNTAAAPAPSSTSTWTRFNFSRDTVNFHTLIFDFIRPHMSETDFWDLPVSSEVQRTQQDLRRQLTDNSGRFNRLLETRYSAVTQDDFRFMYIYILMYEVYRNRLHPGTRGSFLVV